MIDDPTNPGGADPGLLGYLSADERAVPRMPSRAQAAADEIRAWQMFGSDPRVAQQHGQDRYFDAIEQDDQQQRLAEVSRNLEAWHRKLGLTGLANFARTTANDSTFGLHDMALGALGAHHHKTSFDNAHREELYRTEDADRDLGMPASMAAHLIGSVGGYGAALKALPRWMHGRGLFMPATIPLEATRGAMTSPGDLGNRGIGAVRQLTDAGPLGMVNPISRTGMAAAMGTEPAMGAMGLGEYTPSAITSRLATRAGLPEVQW